VAITAAEWAVVPMAAMAAVISNFCNKSGRKQPIFLPQHLSFTP
jgi:hypothetical protein